MIFEVDTQLVLQVYVIYGLLMIFMGYLGYKIISRKRTRLSITCALFYLIIVIMFAFNMAYRGINDHRLNIILNTLTFTLGMFGLLFLFLFNQILLKSEKVFTLKKQMIVILIWIALLSVFFILMANGHVAFEYEDPVTGEVLGQYTLADTESVPAVRDRGQPIWTWTFGIYGLVITQGLYILIYLTASRLKKKMGDSKYARKYTYNIIGCLIFDVLPIGATLSNVYGGAMRTIYLAASLLVIPGAILVYKGLKTEKE